MDKDFLKDLDCPQFVDFTSGIEEQDDTFFDIRYPRHDGLRQLRATSAQEDVRYPRHNGFRSVERATSNQAVAASNGQCKQSNKNGCKRKVFNLGTSPNAGSRSSTPKKDPEKTSPFVNYTKREFRNPFTSTINGKKDTRLRRRSRSASPSGSKAHFGEHQPKIGICTPMQRNRSLSTNDLTIRRPRMFPTTPMCLKRPKTNKLIKSSEEIEMETIAHLQKQLSERLRLNEMSLRRIRGRKPPTRAQNNVPVKTAACFNGPLKCAIDSERNHFKQSAKTAEALERATNAMRSKLKKGTTPAFPMPSFAKLTANLPKDSKLTGLSLRNISTHSCSSQTGSDKTAERLPKRPLGLMSHGFHSGVYFENSQKKTVVKPFSFDRLKETKNSEAAVSEKARNLPNLQHAKVRGKENVPLNIKAGPSTLRETIQKPRKSEK